MHTSEIAALVNRIINIRSSDDFIDLMEKYRKSGYELIPDFDDNSLLTESSEIKNPYDKSDMKNLPFSRFSLLAFLQREANLALGMKYFSWGNWRKKDKLDIIL